MRTLESLLKLVELLVAKPTHAIKDVDKIEVQN
jgi:hypothetical protein